LQESNAEPKAPEIKRRSPRARTHARTRHRHVLHSRAVDLHYLAVFLESPAIHSLKPGHELRFRPPIAWRDPAERKFAGIKHRSKSSGNKKKVAARSHPCTVFFFFSETATIWLA
jgi:hypothetical protein